MEDGTRCGWKTDVLPVVESMGAVDSAGVTMVVGW